MTTTINGDNGTYLNVDMWYGNEFIPKAYGADAFFNDNSATCWGWIYDENGKMIGSYESDDSVLVQENFQIAWVGDEGVTASTVLAASSCDDLKSTISNMLNSVQNTVNKTDTNPDSYNMGFLDGELYVLRKLNGLAGDVTACDSINCATEPKYMANMVTCATDDEAGIMYCRYFNGEMQDFGDNFDEQVALLKELIDEKINNGEVDEVDFPECQVTLVSTFINDDGEVDYAWDDEEVEYCADADADYSEYVD